MRAAVLAGEQPPEHPGHALRVAARARGWPRRSAPVDGWVNSYHHQAVDRLGAGVVPVAWAEDGIVEALELEGDAWVLGVQWELQESWKEDARMLARVRGLRRGGASAESSSTSAASSRVKRSAERDVQPLARRVRPLDPRAEREHVEARLLGGR